MIARIAFSSGGEPVAAHMRSDERSPRPSPRARRCEEAPSTAIFLADGNVLLAAVPAGEPVITSISIFFSENAPERDDLENSVVGALEECGSDQLARMGAPLEAARQTAGAFAPYARPRRCSQRISLT